MAQLPLLKIIRIEIDAWVTIAKGGKSVDNLRARRVKIREYKGHSITKKRVTIPEQMRRDLQRGIPDRKHTHAIQGIV